MNKYTMILLARARNPHANNSGTSRLPASRSLSCLSLAFLFKASTLTSVGSSVASGVIHFFRAVSGFLSVAPCMIDAAKAGGRAAVGSGVFHLQQLHASLTHRLFVYVCTTCIGYTLAFRGQRQPQATQTSDPSNLEGSNESLTPPQAKLTPRFRRKKKKSARKHYNLCWAEAKPHGNTVA